MKSAYLAGILLIFQLSNPTLTQQQGSADACFESGQTLEELTQCLLQFTVPEDFYDQDSYTEAQPTTAQRQAWSAAVATLLDTNNTCSPAIVPSTLQDVYSTSTFDDADGQSFCVLYEHTVSPSTNFFEKGWGYMAVPLSQDAVSRDIHISAPHPLFDGMTSAEATQLFKETGAKSLLVPGRIRTAFRIPSTCIMSTAETTYYMTDPAHNDLEPFFDANVAIWEWQAEHGGCQSASCAFIQLHGKAESTCSGDTIFLSTGLANNTWYTDDVDRPVKRLKEQLLLAFNSVTTAPITASLPSDSTCDLVATKNVVGRYLNNLPSPTSHGVCTEGSDPDSTQGVFIHAEQSILVRGTDSREAWIRALGNTFTDSSV